MYEKTYFCASIPQDHRITYYLLPSLFSRLLNSNNCMYTNSYLLFIRNTLILLCCLPLFALAQADSPIAKQVAQYERIYTSLPATVLLEEAMPSQDLLRVTQKEVQEATYLRRSPMANQQLLRQRPELLRLQLPVPDGEDVILKLYASQPLSEDFVLRSSTQPEGEPMTDLGLHYWGVVEGHEAHSLTAISISQEEIMGFVNFDGKAYNLGKVKAERGEWHILYEEGDHNNPPSAVCGMDPSIHTVKDPGTEGQRMSSNPGNCVRMYVESDYSIFLDKGSVSATTSYVSGVFNQVSILFANEAVNVVISEIFVWSSPDPYTGPSTSNYLNQFRNNLNGNFNGDLAHLVGYGGGGGVAYLNTLCNPFFSVAYSGISGGYNNVPTYSWTINVVAHEIGHNLGSPHTHACAWNGNNTAIDDCGPTAGYSEGCNSAPTPNGGTIMSYCHLVGGVGIDFNLGFGPQPGDLIRNNVYNAPCLQGCGITPTTVDAGIATVVAPAGDICEFSTQPEVVLFNFGSVDLTSVIIQYSVDGGSVFNFPWTGLIGPGGSANIFLPNINVSVGPHTFSASTTQPNNTVDTDASNDGSVSNFNVLEPFIFFADNDNDGRGDPGNTIFDCSPPPGYVENAEDCDDLDPTVFIGAACDDGNPCTINDTYNVNCDCAGELEDDDGDGVCNAEDVCPELDDNLIGTPCDDGNACTEDDVYTDDCECVGTVIGEFDSDNDGVCDEADICPGFDDSLIGTACDDGDPCTVDDVYTDNCECAGTFEDSDNDGVCDGEDQCPEFDDSLIGTACDDGNDCTENDIFTEDCACIGTLIDEDNDGVCDEDDICPGLDDSLIGTACDDGDDCTMDDTYTEDCECVGTVVDTDGDGVCDADDICPEGDDTIDEDQDGIPDDCVCEDAVDTFAQNSLEHQGDGNSTIAYAFEPGMLDPSFTISGLAVDTEAPDTNVALVTIAYLTSMGESVIFGSFSADSLDQVTVMLEGQIDSLFVSLSDDYDGLAEDTISVGLSEIAFCQLVLFCVDQDGDDICDEEDPCPELDNALIGTACDDRNDCTFNDVYTEDCECRGELRDADNDGICDSEDICPNGDDNIDENGNGIPDACEDCGLQDEIGLRPNPLTNFGNDVAYAIEIFSQSYYDVAFQIFDLDATFSSQGGGPYIDFVTVEYQDGNGNVQTYGSFSGTSTSVIDVFIPGEVKSISVTLTNTFPGSVLGSVQSIMFSDITGCKATIGAQMPAQSSSPALNTAFQLPSSNFTLAPNPAFDQATLQLEQPAERATLVVRNVAGATVARYQLSGVETFRLPIQDWGQNTSGCFFITLQQEEAAPVTKRLMIAR